MACLGGDVQGSRHFFFLATKARLGSVKAEPYLAVMYVRTVPGLTYVPKMLVDMVPGTRRY